MPDPVKPPRKGGRAKGTPNHLTVSVKDALEAAFHGLGGVPALVQWGRDNPNVFYPMWVKLLPRNISVEGSLKLEDLLERTWQKPDGQPPEPQVES